MYYLIYLSSATTLLEEEELNEILNISRKNNSLAGITGILIYIDGNIIQLLEGEKEEVNRVYEKISADKRHTGIIKIVDGTIQQRHFPEWYMGYRSMSSEELSKMTGYTNPRELQIEQIDGTVDHPIKIMLDSFIKNNRIQ